MRQGPSGDRYGSCRMTPLPMKLKRLLCILPAFAALALTGCEVPGGPTYVESGPAVSSVSTDFVLSYGNGYSGPGYYYGPPGLTYYRRTPGVYYYRSREGVPGHYWGRWHGDRRHYGGPGGAYRDHDHDGVPNRYDRRPGNPSRY